MNTEYDRRTPTETVLVTGGTGFVAQALIRRLVEENRYLVRASVRSRPQAMPGAVEVIQVGSIDADTDWREALHDASVVVHAAAAAEVPNDALSGTQALHAVNVDGTLNLARQAAAAGVRRMLFISSIKVHGEHTTPGRAFRPEDPPHPEGAYAESKWQAEQGLVDICRQTGMEWVIIRPPLVYGPGVKGNFAAMISWIERGWPLPVLGLRHNLRSLVSVDNLIDLLALCIDHPAAKNGVFLVSDGEDLSTADLTVRLAKAMNRSPRFFAIPTWTLEALLRLLKKPQIRHRLLGCLQADISKTREKLHWIPPVSVDSGLRRAVQPIGGKAVDSRPQSGI
ncbi:NAD-dependent epimerase/dehydratase family protein [Thioalkalivibrio sp.]|uniref:NAD-dependent epimerase/dehydratase family protein n=1 Tax=Thioalkalivibrio sp. TaxID=2093813 RepID=UPI003563978C